MSDDQQKRSAWSWAGVALVAFLFALFGVVAVILGLKVDPLL